MRACTTCVARNGEAINHLVHICNFGLGAAHCPLPTPNAAKLQANNDTNPQSVQSAMLPTVTRPKPALELAKTGRTVDGGSRPLAQLSPSRSIV